jgi:gas vesicle protein
MDKFGKFLAGVLIGSLVGGALGFLLAPATGEKTRKKIMDNIEYVKGEVKKAATERSEELKKELAVLQKKA